MAVLWVSGQECPSGENFVHCGDKISRQPGFEYESVRTGLERGVHEVVIFMDCCNHDLALDPFFRISRAAAIPSN